MSMRHAHSVDAQVEDPVTDDRFTAPIRVDLDISAIGVCRCVGELETELVETNNSINSINSDNSNNNDGARILSHHNSR